MKRNLLGITLLFGIFLLPEANAQTTSEEMEQLTVNEQVTTCLLYTSRCVYETGITPEQIITLELDKDVKARDRNPMELGTYLRQMASDTSKDYYILLDEIQMVESIALVTLFIIISTSTASLPKGLAVMVASN